MNYADASQYWKKVLGLLKEGMSDTSFNSWFSKLYMHSAENNRLILWAENDFIVNAIRTRYLTQLTTLVGAVFGEKYEVVVMNKKDIDTLNKKDESPLNINPKYTFDNFVVGQSNRFAHAASVAVADDPGEAYNPLFIYGGVGLGKTHLMNAIANAIKEKDPDSKIILTTSENFTTEVIEAIARKKTMELRNRMRTVDVLMIDDIQFLSNKQATQEEFFHTFNALFEKKKQIVISSDRPPNEIAALEERIKSRFMSGLIADVGKPDFETRVAILLHKAEMENLDIDLESIAYIAERVDTNIRELEGSLNRVNAIATLEQTSITIDLVKRSLQNLVKVRDEKRITTDRIIDEVAKYFHITRADILSDRRSRDVAIPRQLAIYLTREMTGASTTKIGADFGRDHATIMHACKKMLEMIEKDEIFSHNTSEIKRILTEG
ncbi:MAG: chromosomal replication initiator protein DnaA [Clostridia bacterium]|nr:chromosomal replication initiator protein DnaA [Clostridiales bacterium]MBQ6715832.1 chromosomal replication initiator protein DnaA [Clostridia bacterium]